MMCGKGGGQKYVVAYLLIMELGGKKKKKEKKKNHLIEYFKTTKASQIWQKLYIALTVVLVVLFFLQ